VYLASATLQKYCLIRDLFKCAEVGTHVPIKRLRTTISKVCNTFLEIEYALRPWARAVLARIARGQTNRLTSGVTSPLQGAEQRTLHFSPLNRGRDPGSQTIGFPPGDLGKAGPRLRGEPPASSEEEPSGRLSQNL